MNAQATFDLGGPAFNPAQLLEVRPVSNFTAQRWLGTHHYLANVGNAQVGIFGLYVGDMIAIVTIGNASNAYGITSKYGLDRWKGNVEITRVAVHPEAPTNTASRAIAAVCRILGREGWEWLFSYADTGQGHHGGIYQALNAVYVGISPPLPGYLMDGAPMHPRTVVATYGTQAWPRVRELARERGHTLEKVRTMNAAKHTYILPVANDARTRFAIRRALKRYERPYPKRDTGSRGRPQGTDPGVPAGEGGFDPHPPLEI